MDDRSDSPEEGHTTRVAGADFPIGRDAQATKPLYLMDGRELLAAGHYIHIARSDTPAGHVVRVHPDGREELIKVDWEEARKVLG